MFRKSLADVMRDSRKSLDSPQELLAALSDLSQPRWSQLEGGVRGPTSSEIAGLARALNLSEGKVLDSPAPPKRFKERIAAHTRKSFVRAKAYYPPRDRPSHWRYKAALREWPAEVNAIVERLKMRANYADIEYHTQFLAFDSADECRYALELLDRGAQPALIAPLHLGQPPHLIVDPFTRGAVGHRPFPCLMLGGAFYFFQVSFLTPRLYTVDVLVWDGRWSVIEIDGSGHDFRGDAQRDRALMMPVQHICVSKGQAGQGWAHAC